MRTWEVVAEWMHDLGREQIRLDPKDKKAIRVADLARELSHHVAQLRNCPLWDITEASKHLLSISSTLSKLGFECSLLSLDVDYDRLEQIQKHIRYTLQTNMSNDPHHISSSDLATPIRLVEGSSN